MQFSAILTSDQITEYVKVRDFGNITQKSFHFHCNYII